MSSVFASFHLTIAAPHGDRYPVTARTQTGHEVSEALLLPLDDPTLTVYQTALDYHTPIDESVVIAVGQLLYQTLFQGTIAEAFATARAHADQQKVALRIQLAIDTDTRLSVAAALPWELMATAAGRPLMLEHALVRTFPWNDPIPDLGIPPSERIRLAVTSALPADLADHPIAAEAEVAFIRAAITHSARPIDLIEVPHLTRDRLTDLLTNQRPHIVHHIGHGSIQRGMGYLDIERADQSRDRLSAREFSTMLHQSGVQLVVLNACHTSSAGESLLTSFAPIFITDRIPVVIGMQAAILNRTGHCFANAFYATLGTGGSIDASLIAARKAIHTDGHEHGAWGFPTLYSRVPHGQLWGDRTPQPVDPLAQRDRERITNAAQQIESDRLLTLRLQGFVGRVTELAVIREHVEAIRPTGGYVLIKAAAGEGKSSSIAKLIQEAGIAQTPHHFIALTTGREYQLGLLRAVVAQLILKHGLTVSYFPEDSYPAMKAEFARILDELSKQGIHETIYLDGLDQLQPEIDGTRDLSFLPPQPPPGIVIVLGSRPDETLKPLEISHRVDYDLPPLGKEDALALWRSTQPGVADGLLHDLYIAIKGNALFVHLAADTMQGTSVVDATSLIRQIEQNPSNLFGITLERIKGRSMADWRAIWKPMLALLLVAQEPLRLDVLGNLLGHDHDTMQDAVWVLGGLVSKGIDQRVALHHLLFRDYLAVSVFNAREIKRWQQRLADWCASDLNVIWTDHADMVEQSRRVYARHHYITHLSGAENWPTLWQVLDTGDYGAQKTRFDPSTRLYALDLDQGRESAINAGQSTEEHIQNLPRLWKYSLLRTSLTSRVDQWPDEVFEVLAMLGRTHEALARIELISDPIKKIYIWKRLIQYSDIDQQTTILLNMTRSIKEISMLKRIEPLMIVAAAASIMGNTIVARMMLSNAVEITNTIDQPWVQSETLHEIAIVAATNGHIEQSLIVCQAINNVWSHAKTLCNIATIVAMRGNPAQAAIMADSIHDPEYRIIALAAITTCYAINGDLEQAYRVVEQAIAVATHKINLTPEALGSLAKAHIAIGNLNEAISIISTITSTRKRTALFADMAFAATTIGNINYASMLLDTTINSLDTIQAKRQDQILVTIAKTAASIGDLAKALAIASTIDNETEHVETLCAIAKIATTLKEHNQSRFILEQATDKVRTFEPQYHATSLATIAMAAATIGDNEKALSLVNTVLFREHPHLVTWYRAVAIETIVYQIPRNNHQSLQILKQVYIHAKTITQPWVRNETIRAISDAMTSGSHFDEAMGVINTIDSVSVQLQAYSTIAQSLAMAGEIEKALTIATSRFDRQHLSDMLDNITQTVATTGNFKQAIMIATMLDRRWKQVEALTRIAHSAALLGDIEQVVTIAKLIKNLGEKIPTKLVIATVKAYVVIGNLKDAKVIANKINHTKRRGEALYIIVEVEANTRQFDEAITTTTSIEDPTLYDDALVIILKAYTMVNNIIRATYIATLMKTDWKQVEAFCIIARAFTSQDHSNQANHILDQAYTIALNVKNIGHRANALEAIATTAASIGNLTMAITVTSMIRLEKNCVRSICAIAQGATTLKNRESIRRILEQIITITSSIDDKEIRTAALIAICNAAIATDNEYLVSPITDQILAIPIFLGDAEKRARNLAAIAAMVSNTKQLYHRLLQLKWRNCKNFNDVWESINIVSPLLSKYLWLGLAILEEEAWVNDQLKRLA